MIIKLWRGEYGLAKTWWLFGVLGTLLLNMISGPLNVVVSGVSMSGILGIVLTLAALLVAVIGVCYGVVVTVGIVRSAQAYRGNRIWSRLAVGFTAIAWIGSIIYVAVS